MQELAHTDVTVVCAGAKAILDLPLTLEYLETFGVPVLGYRSDHLGAFYSSDSGLNVDYRMDSPEEVASAIWFKRKLGLKGGVLVSNPIPKEDEIPNEKINAFIDAALKDAEKNRIHGKEITPYLLSHIKEHTKGESLKANIRLVYHNAEVGAAIAKAYANIRKSGL